MGMMIIRHKVSDYGKWRPAFDQHAAMQKAAGLNNPRVLRSADDKNEIVARPVKTGAMHNGLREIADGLAPGDHVVVSGVAQVRPGIKVEPKVVDMPGGKTESGEMATPRALARVSRER